MQTKKLIISTLLLVILGFTSTIPYKNSSDSAQMNNYRKEFDLRTSALTNLTGSPIFIDNLDPLNDWSVAVSQAWCSGSGQFNDPYIIRNVLLDGLYSTPCIEIKNSIDWFIIENCTLYNGRYDSIKMTNVTNGIFINNTLTENQFGLNILRCHNNTFIENDMFGCSRGGIKMDECENNTLIKNSIGPGSDDGICMSDSHYNDFINNNLSQSDCGIFVRTGSFNNFIGNIFNNNRENGLQFYSYYGPCNYNNVTGNIANNNGYSGFAIFGSINNTLYNNTAYYNGEHGIEVWSSQNHTILDNILKYNDEEGMFIRTSSDSYFYNNHLEANHESGFYISENRDLKFRNNVMVGQEEMTLYGSRSQLVSLDIDLSNTVNGKSVHYYVSLSNLDLSNFTDSGHSILVNCTDSIVTNSSGVALYYSNNITVQNNNKISDLYTGVYIDNSDYNNISRNIIRDCFKGISVSYSDYNDIINNTLIKHDEYGIYFYESTNTNISSNRLFECGIGMYAESGYIEDIASQNFYTNNYVNGGKLYFYESKNNLDSSNFTDAGLIILANCSGAKISNVDASVSLFYSSDNEITNINVSHYFNYGIRLHNSHRNNITHSSINRNSMGIILRKSNSNNISNNDIHNSLGTGSWEFWHIENPGAGIFLTSSHSNIVSHNLLENSTFYGLYLRHSDNNDVVGNNISNNDYGGFYSYYGDNNDINQSRVYQNDGDGIYLKGCNSNTFFDNSISNNSDSGILLETSDNNEFISNTLSYNKYGTYLDSGSSGNTYYLNNFTSNSVLNAFQASTNNWNSPAIGNYWDEYVGKDTNDDNIGDSAFNFGTGTDNYPIFWDGPVISLNSPSSSENFESAPSFEIVAVEGVEHTTWYTLDNGITNITSPGLISTIDETAWLSATDGPIQLTFYVNDSKGYMDQVSVEVTKVTDIPLVAIITPTLNQVFGTQPPDFTITITDTSSIVSRWYTLDGGINNYSFTGLTNTISSIAWEAAPEGDITLTFYAEDEIGNIGDISRIIIKDLSEIPPETPPGIFGYNLIALIGVISVITAILIRKRVKS
jgi:parallel beta-helix repeat protein